MSPVLVETVYANLQVTTSYKLHGDSKRAGAKRENKMRKQSDRSDKASYRW